MTDLIQRSASRTTGRALKRNRGGSGTRHLRLDCATWSLPHLLRRRRRRRQRLRSSPEFTPNLLDLYSISLIEIMHHSSHLDLGICDAICQSPDFPAEKTSSGAESKKMFELISPWWVQMASEEFTSGDGEGRKRQDLTDLTSAGTIQ